MALFVPAASVSLVEPTLASRSISFENPTGARGMGIAERVDDYCAVAFVMCAEPQPVPRLDVAAAIADIGRRPYEAS